MPTYIYECSSCSHSFEHFQSMTSRIKRKCPECGKKKLVRLIGKGSAVIFRGEGFYCNDYSKDKKEN
jgi:putative FmdB family regulatory protein